MTARTICRAALWTAGAALCLVVPAAEASQPPSSKISDERTHTSWAHPIAATRVLNWPAASARGITRLREYTENGYHEVYLVLRRHVDARGREWLNVRIPMRPNGRTGWVRAQSLGPLRTVHTRLLVDRRRLWATLRRDGRPVWRSRIGIGKPGASTPGGRFWIRERLRLHSADGLYGPLAFGTAAYSRLSDWPGGGVIGIHGTNQPELIPGRPSHGCIRVPNRKILQLGRLMPIGTPVSIR
jgi:hypothetical protein